MKTVGSPARHLTTGDCQQVRSSGCLCVRGAGRPGLSTDYVSTRYARVGLHTANAYHSVIPSDSPWRCHRYGVRRRYQLSEVEGTNGYLYLPGLPPGVFDFVDSWEGVGGLASGSGTGFFGCFGADTS